MRDQEKKGRKEFLKWKREIKREKKRREKVIAAGTKKRKGKNFLSGNVKLKKTNWK